MSLSRDLGIASRFFLAPINTGLAYLGTPTDHFVRFHKERSGHKIGVAYIGNVAVAEQYRTNDGTAVLRRDNLDVWSGLARIISNQGSVPGIQLACKVAPAESQRSWKCLDRQEFIRRTSLFLSEISRERILQTCEQFVVAAALASEAGFRVAQIHAAHGYLLALLLNRVINKRSDEFGDGLHALARISNGIASKASGLTLDVRISILDGLEEADEERRYRAGQMRRLADIGYRIISLSAGMYDVDRRMIYPGRAQGQRVYVPDALAMAVSCPATLWNVAGNLGPIADLETQEPNNLTFAIGRPLIADPEFVEKSLSHRHEEIVRCVFSGHCHYFSRGRTQIECGVNPGV